MNTDEQITLKLNSAEFKIPDVFPNLSCIDTNVYRELIKNKSYTIKSDVKDEVFKSFINFWVNNVEPNIDEENYYDFNKLSDEFNFPRLKDLIHDKEYILDEYQKYLLKLKDPSIKDKHVIENMISKKIDLYILKSSQDLFSLPFDQLLRLFRSPSFNLTEPEIAYRAFVKYYQDTNDLNIFSLLPFLDGSKLSKESIEECLEKEEERLGFKPKISYSSIEGFLNKNDAKIAELEAIQADQRTQIQILTDDLNNKQTKIEQLESSIKKLFRMFIDTNSISEFTNYLIPIPQNYQQININQFTFTDNGNTYTIEASSTLDDKLENSCINLINRKNESQGGNLWSSSKSSNSFIRFTFSKPVHANIISITAPDQKYREVPSNISIFAGNAPDNLSLLKSFDIWSWSQNEKKTFMLDNVQSYTIYKLEFTKLPCFDQDGKACSISELNLGEFLL